MKNQKGFIQTPFFVAIIIVGVLAVIGGGYFGAEQYVALQQRRVEAKKQEEALRQAQHEIDKLKMESEVAREKQKQLEQKIVQREKSPETLSISAQDLAPYLSGVVNVYCFGQRQGSGSGTLWDFGRDIGYAVLTNSHVIVSNKCAIFGEDFPPYNLDTPILGNWNLRTDVAVSRILSQIPEKPAFGLKSVNISVSDLNYSISSLRRCPVQVPLGSPVVIVGYPAFSEKDVAYEGGIATQSFQTVTNGVISAHDTSVLWSSSGEKLPYVNYFVSAKIDSGNSGGIALSKDTNGLCVLGLPTWLSIGNFETQGLVQNIHNVFFKP